MIIRENKIQILSFKTYDLFSETILVSFQNDNFRDEIKF